jgi:uncharacterized protein YdeI (YjbR/CyaY-like superfamily)
VGKPVGKKDARVDDYIAKAPAFAKPILTEIRERVHSACPDVEETIKWRQPSFEYKGLMCGMAAFKEHCVFGYWKAPLVLGAAAEGANAMGYPAKITTVADLPSKTAFRAHVKKAMALNEAGIGVERPKKARKPEAVVPDDLAAAVKKNKKAQAAFDEFSPSHRREYIEWITETKTDTTRAKRIQQAVEWVAEGKPRNWKYMQR